MCDSVVIVAPGRVLYGKNSDRDPNEAQVLDWQPARDHAPAATLACTWIEIPQVRRTHGVLLSRPFWGWGAEMGANEHGLVAGNHAVFTLRRVPRRGLTGMDLVRLALERAASAEEAVDVIVGLIARHGQGGGCGHERRSFRYHNSFVLADARGAIVVETSGREWAVERVAGARTVSNRLSIPGFAGGRSDPVRSWASRSAQRQARTAELAARADGPAGIAAILRSHGEPGRPPAYDLLTGALGAPCVHAGGVAAASQTTASWISELTPSGARHWATATAAPCVSVFKPVSVAAPLPAEQPDDRYDARWTWWRHERWHRTALRDPAAIASTYERERDEMERRFFAAPSRSEAAFGEVDAAVERWRERAQGTGVTDRRPAWVRRYWRVRDRRAGLPA